MKYIPHNRLHLNKSEQNAVCEVLKSGHIAYSNQCRKLEETVAEFLQIPYVLAVSSGTAALHLSLLGLDVGKYDAVLMPTLTCPALSNAASYTNAKIVLVDANNDDYNINVENFKQLGIDNYKAIICTHNFGCPEDMPELLRVVTPERLIEDCTHSFGARCNGRLVGTYGKVGIVSLYATKLLPSGTGGLLFTQDENVFLKAKDLASYGGKCDGKTRFNYLLSDVHAAIAMQQFHKLKENIERRQEIAAMYNDKLKNSGLELPKIFINRDHLFYRYILRLNNVKRSIFRTKLENEHVGTGLGVLKPLHFCLQKAPDQYPIAEEIWPKMLSIPCYPSLTDDEVYYVTEAILRCL